jgi:TatD related DNase
LGLIADNAGVSQRSLERLSLPFAPFRPEGPTADAGELAASSFRSPCRDCEADIIKQLEQQQKPVRGVLHSFTGTLDDAQQFLELGLYIS